ncbi:MAG TPA: 2-hydroxyacyl-CoA dehydratase family protein [Thermodesulfobacteriota bacterium]|nr:2-hydroxyacyl-CoA dehydratase family protein [Thermodesulfobacteriota bacterium]
MKEVSRISYLGQQLWQQVLDLAVSKPIPITAFDCFFHLALIVTLRGTQQTIDYYEALRDEVKERVQAGIGAINPSKGEPKGSSCSCS